MVLGLIGVIPTNYLAKEVDLENTYEELYDMYQEDPEFKNMLREYGEEYVEDYLQKIAERVQKENNARGGSGDYCYEHVKNIKQTKTYNCGSTTTLQTLYGLESEDEVAGSTDTAKIETLDREYDVDEQGSMYVYQIVNALNKYNVYGSVYQYKTGSSLGSASVFEERVAVSLTCCRPVILHARTQYLSYYSGKATGHYLSLDQINRTTKMVRIVDCNYNSSYYGVHNVPLNEAYNSISASGRYLIY